MEGVLLFFKLVVVVGVDGVFGDDFAGSAMDDEGVGASNEEEDGIAGVGAADAEVVEFPGVADRDEAGGVDDVVADTPVPSGDVDGGFGFGKGVVGLGVGVCRLRERWGCSLL